MKTKKKKSGWRSFKIVLSVLLAIILVVLGGVTYIAHDLLGNVNYLDPDSQNRLTLDEIREYLNNEDADELDPDAEVLDDNAIDWGDNDTQIGVSDDILNILLIGMDSTGNSRSRSDVMILVTYNKKMDTLTMTSFMRDLYVQIPGYGNSKLNHSYAWGGMDLLNETLAYNFGIHVDGNIEVNFNRFTDLIELLGGVDIELRSDEAAYINRSAGYGSLSAGTNHLDGTQALIYARIRKLDGAGDFGRTERQRKLLLSLIDEFKDAELSNILSLLSEGMSCLSTDMSQTQLIGLVKEFFPVLSGATIVSQRIPADGAYYLASANGMSVIKADMDAARQLLEDTLGTD